MPSALAMRATLPSDTLEVSSSSYASRSWYHARLIPVASASCARVRGLLSRTCFRTVIGPRANRDQFCLDGVLASESAPSRMTTEHLNPAAERRAGSASSLLASSTQSASRCDDKAEYGP